MNQKIIYRFIKSPCGQNKYEKLSLNTTLSGKIRLIWFVIIAALRDLNFKN